MKSSSFLEVTRLVIYLSDDQRGSIHFETFVPKLWTPLNFFFTQPLRE